MLQGLKKQKNKKTMSSLESRCTVNKQHGIRDQDRTTIKYDPKRLKFIVIITMKEVYNMSIIMDI